MFRFSLATPELTIRWKPNFSSRKAKEKELIQPESLGTSIASSATVCHPDNLIFTQIVSYGSSRKKSETFEFWFLRAFDWTYSSEVWFSIGFRGSYDSRFCCKWKPAYSPKRATLHHDSAVNLLRVTLLDYWYWTALDLRLRTRVRGQDLT